MTQMCLITLKPLGPSNRNPRMRDSEARALYGTTTFSGQIPYTRQELFSEGAKSTQGMSISGVQQKLSLRFDKTARTLVPTSTGGTFIIKPSPDQYPQCAELEHLGMLISQLLGIETAQQGLVEFSNGEKAYITRRFDRADEDRMKLPMEDLCSLSDLPKDDKYESSYEAAGLVLREATGGKLVVLQDYVMRILVAYLIGNEDLHLKNFSVIRNPGDTSTFYSKLSPNYDNVPTIVYDLSVLNGYLAMPLMPAERTENGGEYSKAYQYFGYYTQQDFIDLGESLGLNARVILTSIQRIEKKIPEMKALIECADIREAYKTKLLTTVSERMRALNARMDS